MRSVLSTNWFLFSFDTKRLLQTLESWKTASWSVLVAVCNVKFHLARLAATLASAIPSLSRDQFALVPAASVMRYRHRNTKY